jgi:ERCC4-related helicase
LRSYLLIIQENEKKSKAMQTHNKKKALRLFFLALDLMHISNMISTHSIENYLKNANN